MEEEKKVEEVTNSGEETKEEIKIEELKLTDSKKKLIIMISGISLIMLILLIILFIVFFKSPKKVITNKKIGGEVNISYTDKTNSLNVVNIVPVEDSAAIKDLTGDNYFEFSVETKVDGAKEVKYEISVSKNADKSTVNDEDIRIYLEKENSGSYAKVFGPAKFKGISKQSDLGTPKGDMVLAEVTNNKTITENYRLKIWLASNAAPSTVAQNYSVDINLVGDAE